MWSLPISVEIDGKEYAIRNKCDYRVVLDCIIALNDTELEARNRVMCALYIFYEDLSGCMDIDLAIKEMIKIINLGEEEKEGQTPKPKLMDWEHDFPQIAPPISRVLGYSVRDPQKWTHYYDFVGAYMEIGECVFSTIVSIRVKKNKHKKLEKWEEEFCREHPELIALPQKYSQEEEELFSLFE